MSRPQTPTLPRDVERALRGIDRRLRLGAMLRGLGMAGVVAALGAVAAMAGDYAGDLPSAIRWGTWAAWAAVVGALLAARVIRPLARRFDHFELANIAERADARLGGSLSAAVDLVATPHGSPGLIGALVDQAAGRAKGFDARRAVGLTGEGRWFAAGVMSVALAAAPCLLWPEPFGVLSGRFLAPWSGGDRVVLEVEPGDRVVARGSGLKIAAKARARFGRVPGADAARVEWIGGDGVARSARMEPSGTGGARSRAFAGALPGLAAPVEYQVVVGSKRSRAFRVEVAEPPRVEALEARVEPPTYTRLPAGISPDPRRIEAVAGSRIAFRVRADRPVAEVAVLWPIAAPGPPQVRKVTPGGEGREAALTFEAGASGPFEVALIRDRKGLDGVPEGGRIAIRSDAPPTLEVAGPPESAEAGPGDVLRVAVTARDDFGVAAVELHHEVRRVGTASATGRTVLNLAGLGGPEARGVGMLALAPLGLRPGDAVAYRVRAADNRPEALGGPNEAWSGWASLRIAAKAEPMQARQDRLRKEAIAARLDAIRGSVAAVRREVEPLRRAAELARRSAQAWGADRDAELLAREADAGRVVDQLQALARDLEAEPDFAPLARPARQAAEVEAEAARAQVAGARNAPDAASRLAALRPLPARLDAVRVRADDLRRRLDALAKLADDRRKLGDLAAREDGLAAEADRPDADAARLRADQEEVRRDLDSLLAKAPALRSGLLRAQAEEAARLAEQARGLADRQRAEALREPDPSDPRFLALAEAQRAIEADARRLAAEVDESLAENHRPRANADAVGRAAEPLNRGDVEGSRRALEEAEAALRRLARDLADVPADPRALALRLARRQDALAGDVTAAIAEALRPRGDQPPEARAELIARLAPLAERQESIARLADAIATEGPGAAVAREARDAASRAAANLRDPRPREAEGLQAAARRGLHRLAEAQEDPARRREETRRAIEEAGRKAAEVARDLERPLVETAPTPDRPIDRASADLAGRLAPLLPRQEEAAKLLAALDVESPSRPRRDRASARALRLSEVIREALAAAPSRTIAPEPRPPATWHVVGPYPTTSAPPPVAVDRPIDPTIPLPGPDGRPIAWKAASMGGDGRVDLGQMFGKLNARSAFALATIASPARRKATLVIGSDDSLAVWLNGVRVFDFDGERPYGPGQDRVEVDLAEGANRLLVRCGNASADWQFSVNVTPPLPDGFDPARAQRAREALARARVEAQAAVDRLVQEARGQQPADDLALELAGEQGMASPSNPADRARIAAALRNLPAPDAPAEKAEALLRAEALALDSRPAPLAIKAAAEATRALALRLADGKPVPAAPPAPLPDDPDLGLTPDHIERAAELARRQRHVREGLQALGAERASAQDRLRAESVALGRSLEGLRDRAREARARAESLARASAEIAADQAPRAMAQAAEQRAQGRADAAREAGRQAADLAERAARHAEDLANGLRTEAAEAAGPESTPPPAGLAEATAALREAAAQLARADGGGSNPAPAMQRAADSLRSAAQPPGPPAGPGSPGSRIAGTSTDANPHSAPAGVAAPDLSPLPDLARQPGGRAWGELPAHLRAEILRQARGNPRPDYARLIELYFREIAADPARSEPR